MDKIKSVLKSLWANDSVKRVVHTFWQTALAFFLAGASGILSALLNTHRFSDAISAIVALVIGAVAAGLAAAKAVVVAKS